MTGVQIEKNRSNRENFGPAPARAQLLALANCSHHYIIFKMAEKPDAEVTATGADAVTDAVIDGGANAEEVAVIDGGASVEEVVGPLEGDAAIAQEQELADKRTPSVKENCSLVQLTVLQRLERQPPVQVTHANGKILQEPNTLHYAKLKTVGDWYSS